MSRATQRKDKAMSQIRVVVSGTGKMGTLVAQAVHDTNDLVLAGVFATSRNTIATLPRRVENTTALEHIDNLFNADVVVDFSNAEVTEELLPYLIEVGIHPVIGTSGLSDNLIQTSVASCAERNLGGVIAPNFSLGGALMMRFAEQAARFYDFASITEIHHERKVDAPSGTAVATAQQMRQARGRDFEHSQPNREPLLGARGAQYGGISIHSDRLLGAVAHQQVVLGGTGELLTVRHDSTSRESFIPGVLLAIRSVRTMNSLVIGLDKLLDL